MQKHTLSSFVFLLIVMTFTALCYLMVPSIDDDVDAGVGMYEQYRNMQPGVARCVVHCRPSDIVQPSVWIHQSESVGIFGSRTSEVTVQ